MTNKYIPLPESMTIGECYSPAMEMTDADDAQAYLDALVERHIRCYGKSDEEARRIELSNIGYYAGYYDDETRDRVEKLFGAIHPIFGTTKPTTEEAFNLGLEHGKRIANQK